MLSGPEMFPPLNNVGDITYRPLESTIVTPAPTSAITGEVLDTTDLKESERRKILQTQEFTFRPVTGSNTDPSLNKTATTERKLEKPKMIAITKKLKTNAKPVIYTTEVDTYKSIASFLEKSDMKSKVDLVLTSQNQIDNLQGTTRPIKVDHQLERNLSQVLAIV